ncbi:MAG: class I SAM-dependent methyltransferase [Armatimonadota bacterium]|nr:class I SAM-dependent methyltransferase [Armatimonadota bacterium]
MRRVAHGHYFTSHPVAPHHLVEIRTTLRGREFRFLTDRGVFSRGRVDRGTRLLIEAMEIDPGDIVLDLGCGYGPIGLVAATLAPRGWAYLVDVNERAVDLARRNAILNGLKNVEVRLGDGFEPVQDLLFDVILTNPPIRTGKANLSRLFQEAFLHLRPGGRFYFVARTSQGAKTLASRVQEIFGNVEEVERGGGFRVYKAVHHA